MANAESDSTGAENQNARSEVNFLGGLLGLVNLIMITNHPEVVLGKFLPGIPLGGFDAAGKIGGWFALAAIMYSRPAGFRHWLGVVAGVLLIDLAGFSLAVLGALTVGQAGLEISLLGDTTLPQRAMAMLLGFAILIPFMGGLGKTGLLPEFRWPVYSGKTAQSWSTGWVPRRFANLMALVAVLSLVMGSWTPVLAWVSAAAPNWPLALIHPELSGLPVAAAAIVTVGTSMFAPGGLRRWPMTGMAALVGVAGMAALMGLLALTAPLWTWVDAGEAALSAIVTGLPALALIPLGIAAWRAQKSGEAEAEGESA